MERRSVPYWLHVLGASLRDVFLMKMYRADPNDIADMRAIWPHIVGEFAHGEDVAAAFVAAYPHAPDDEYLVSFICRDIAGATGHPLPER